MSVHDPLERIKVQLEEIKLRVVEMEVMLADSLVLLEAIREGVAKKPKK